MNTDAGVRRLDVRGTAVRVVRKPIKHLHLGVYPPDGRVRVAAPPQADRRGSTDLHERLSRRQQLDGFRNTRPSISRSL